MTLFVPVAVATLVGSRFGVAYVHGPGTDQPILWYEGSGTTDKRYLTTDERGSITAVTDGNATTLAVNSYDEYGIPAATNLGRFQYTGQAWLPEVGLYYYKARMYSPTLGRFMQSDPIGYGDGINWYNYVDSDPVNFVDPMGLEEEEPPIDVIGRKPKKVNENLCSRDPSPPLCTGDGQSVIIVNGSLPKPPKKPSAPKKPKPPKPGWCGSDGSGWVPDGNWGAACKKHDACYGSPSANKEQCDLSLMIDITKECSKRGAQSNQCATVGAVYGFGLLVEGI